MGKRRHFEVTGSIMADWMFVSKVVFWFMTILGVYFAFDSMRWVTREGPIFSQRDPPVDPSLSFKGVAVVAGACDSLGQYTVRQLKQRGAQIIIAGCAKENSVVGRKLADEVGGRFVDADFTSRTSLQDLVQTLSDQTIDLFIFNAWLSHEQLKTIEDPSKVYQIQHLAAAYLTRGLLPNLRKSQDPRVLIKTSNNGYYAELASVSGKAETPLQASHDSALANLLLVEELAAKEKDIKFLAIDTGYHFDGPFHNAVYDLDWLAVQILENAPFLRRKFYKNDEQAAHGYLAFALRELRSNDTGILIRWGLRPEGRLEELRLEDQILHAEKRTPFFQNKVWESDSQRLAL